MGGIPPQIPAKPDAPPQIVPPQISGLGLGKERSGGNIWECPPPRFGRKPGTPQKNSASRIELLDPENLPGGIKTHEFPKIKNTTLVV